MAFNIARLKIEMTKRKTSYLQSGQAVLIVLLGMAVALTVVLSILGASTTDIKLSTNESESQRAFSAAESGIEQSLATNNLSSGTLTNTNAKYSATVSSFAKGQVQFSYPQPLPVGESAILWFVSHLSNGTLGCNILDPGYTGCFAGKFFNVCWGKSGTVANAATTPAVEVSVIYLTNPLDFSTAKVAKAIYDPNPGRLTGNNYSSVNGPSNSCTIDGNTYAFEEYMDVGAMMGIGGGYSNPVLGPEPQFVYFKLLYNDTPQPIGFVSDKPLPSQGNQIDSTGTLNTSTRKIEVIRSFNDAPGIFDSAVFSNGDAKQ